MRTRYAEIEGYKTKDGSQIRELWHPAVHGVGNQSLAEASLPVGGKTMAHRHVESEEIYYFLAGQGVMRLGEEEFEVQPGDTVRIEPGQVHQVENTGEGVMRILCVCTPPYSHEDTDLVE